MTEEKKSLIPINDPAIIPYPSSLLNSIFKHGTKKEGNDTFIMINYQSNIHANSCEYNSAMVFIISTNLNFKSFELEFQILWLNVYNI